MPACPFCSKAVPDNSTICPHCLRAQPVVIPTVGRTGKEPGAALHGKGRLLILAVALVAIGGYAFSRRDSIRESYAPAKEVEVDPNYVAPVAVVPVQNTVKGPIEVAIADSASAAIAPGAYLAFPFDGQDRSACRLRGSVHVISGGPVDLFVVDGMGADDLANGRPPRKYYENAGVTDATLDASLDGRSHYSLVVANLGARARAKKVRLKSLAASCAD